MQLKMANASIAKRFMNAAETQLRTISQKHFAIPHELQVEL